MTEYVDASVFLGMHSMDEKTRVACKNYFVRRLNNEVGMSFEQVGKCDDVVWGLSRKEQDVYYPFMDNLHTIMRIKRVAYDEKDVEEAMKNPSLQDLSITDKLTIGMVIARNGKLCTTNPSLLARKDFPVYFPELSEELSFSQPLEELYQKSLEVRICTQE